MQFPVTFDLYPYYTPPPTLNEAVDVASDFEQGDFLYDLASVVEHHGTGLTSGHYTAYCWNTDAGEGCMMIQTFALTKNVRISCFSSTDSWVHCNDNRIKRCLSSEVSMAQAYILFYARQRGCSPVLKHH